MKYSQLFTKTQKFAPSDEIAKNAQLLIRGGYIHKSMAGVYDILPLGLRVLKKIENIIREEINEIGGQEVHLATLQSKELWEKTDRWDDKKVDMWFKTELKNGTEVGIGNTHEEPLAMVMKDSINSYRDLPQYVYQFQTKFRNEKRAKSGILRGREFLMKDLYSFSISEKEHEDFYEKVKKAYLKIFDRVGLGDKTFVTFASGGVFSKYSHEFQTLADAGEDTIYLDKKKKIAINKEVFTDEVVKDLGLKKDDLEEVKAIETGNIFSLGTRFSEPLELLFEDKDGTRKPVIMGSYGIGLGRLMGTIVEIMSDDAGIVWPEAVAPFKVHLINIGDTEKEAEKIYDELTKNNIEVLWDERDTSPGEKFADADLLGIPYRLVVSDKTLEKKGVELRERASGKEAIVSIKDVVKKLK